MSIASPSPNDPRAERECGCPPWVIRCAHWDGQVLVLSDEAGHQTGCGFCDGNTGPQVFQMREPWSTCPYCAGPAIYPWQVQFASCQDDLPAAEAEFHHREAALLGREA
jgi:hypothetical protein